MDRLFLRQTSLTVLLLAGGWGGGCLRAGPSGPLPETDRPAAVRAWFSARFSLPEAEGRVRGRLVAVEDGRFRIEVQDLLGRAVLVMAYDGRELTVIDSPGGAWAAGPAPERLHLADCRPVWRIAGGPPPGPPPPLVDPCGTEPFASRDYAAKDAQLRVELEGRRCDPEAELDPHLFRPDPPAGAARGSLAPLLDLPALRLLAVVGCRDD